MYVLATFIACIFISINVIDCDKFWDFSAVNIKGKEVKFSQYMGKVLLVVNVASECGFTDNHYKALVKARKAHGAEGHFEILAFPCNQFGGQEPKDEAEIAKFVKNTYKVNFPMFSKIDVIGENVPDFWQFLVEESGSVPNWNFWKYLVGVNGKVIKAWGPQVAVEEIIPHIVAQTKQVKATQASVDKIKDALAKAQAKMGDKGLKFQIRDDL